MPYSDDPAIEFPGLSDFLDDGYRWYVEPDVFRMHPGVVRLGLRGKWLDGHLGTVVILSRDEVAHIFASTSGVSWNDRVPHDEVAGWLRGWIPQADELRRQREAEMVRRFRTTGTI